MVKPTQSQTQIRDHEGLSLLIVAPAGCGKTEALALRAHGLLRRGAIAPPRRILVTTFSNRARDNVRDRLLKYLTPREMRDNVTVSNFHVLSARIFRSHATVLGMDPGLIMPESDWVAEQCRARRLDFNLSSSVQARLRSVKLQTLDDATIESELEQGGDDIALDIERQRRSEGRLTYDDLPRLAELILANDGVADLYRNHFGAIIVDEFQDLTPQQRRIINRIGFGRTTYAGDLAQGIYGFAGACPDETYAAIKAECSIEIRFTASHRSSPAVLTAVNSLVNLTSGHNLTAANPAHWPGGGLAGGVRFQDVDSEANWVIDFCHSIYDHAPDQRIGIVSRTKARRRFADALAETSGIPCYRWEDGVLNTATAKVMKAMLTRMNVSDFATADDRLGFLKQAAGVDSILDPDDRSALVDAISWCYELLIAEVAPAAIRSRIRVGDQATLLELPGIHLLTGHAGKGQQFYWVVVVGLEEDTLPDFRQKANSESLAEEARILAVMISRARHGVVLSMSNTIPTTYGNFRHRDPSQFCSELRNGGLIKRDAISKWLRDFDWANSTRS